MYGNEQDLDNWAIEEDGRGGEEKGTQQERESFTYSLYIRRKVKRECTPSFFDPLAHTCLFNGQPSVPPICHRLSGQSGVRSCIDRV